MSNHKKNKHGLNLNHSQHVDIPPMIHESVIIPSNNVPVRGSYFIIDMKQKGVILHDITLQFQVSKK